METDLQQQNNTAAEEPIELVSEKTGNQLKLAVGLSEEERSQSEDLQAGYNEITKEWELIVKYHGNLEELAALLEIKAVPLLNSYAIITLSEEKLPALLAREEIEYVEKPNRMYFELQNSLPAACVIPVTRAPYYLSGADVLVGIVDSGIDYAHPDFRKEDGSTRIALLWDQTLADGVFTEEQINEALRAGSIAQQLRLIPSTDASGHGTSVAGIAAGNGRASGGRYRGVAPESTLMVVKLGNSVGNSFPRTTNLMAAVDFLAREAERRGMPMAINLSFGNNYGSHDGTSLLEQYLDDAADYYKLSIVTGMGNEGAARGHAAGRLVAGGESVTHEFMVGRGESSLSLQLWKSYTDRFRIELTAPSGERAMLYEPLRGISPEPVRRFILGNTKVLVYLGQPKPYSTNQEILFEFLPEQGNRIDSGIWKLTLEPARIVTGEYQLWLPAAEALGENTGFLLGEPETTLTIPATSAKVISVGAYDALENSYAYFSGRGYTVGSRSSKPDLVAPGVNIMSPAPGGGYATRTGTSMAAPFVSGAAALLMQWGIVNGNDPYMYGEKIKAALWRGARQLPGEQTPSPKTGFGALCVEQSIPGT